MISSLVLELNEPFKIVVENCLNTISPYVLLEQETWFEPEVPFLRAFLKQGMRVIDIGTNCGFYTLLAAHNVGEEGHVFGFEPGLKPARLLKESLCINNYRNVTLHACAVGKTRGNAWFLDKENTELSAIASLDTPGAREVAVESLDHLHQAGELTAIDFIKIDAEGFEDPVVSGGAHFFAHENPLVMMEVISETSVDQTMGPAYLLKEMGYDFYRYSPGVKALVPLVLNKPGDFVLNIFLCKADRAESLRSAGLLVTPKDTQAPYGPADPSLFKDYFLQLPAVRSCDELQQLNNKTENSNIEFAGMASEFILSQDGARSLPERFVRLDRAERWIDFHFNLNLPIEHLISFMPVWSACGRITLAPGLLSQIANGEIKITLPFSQPFLPMNQKWEIMPVVNNNFHMWLASMLAEKLEMSGGFSSIYKNDNTIRTYNLLHRYGYLTPEIERRAALVSLIRSGSKFTAPVFIDGMICRNQKIWNEISVRLAHGEENFTVLKAGTELEIA